MPMHYGSLSQVSGGSSRTQMPECVKVSDALMVLVMALSLVMAIVTVDSTCFDLILRFAKSRYCFGCSLPFQPIKEIIFHKGFVNSMACTWKDTIAPVCWYIWRNNRHVLEMMCDTTMSDQQFSEWLISVDGDDMMNAWNVFVAGWDDVHHGS